MKSVSEMLAESEEEPLVNESQPNPQLDPSPTGSFKVGRFVQEMMDEETGRPTAAQRHQERIISEYKSKLPKTWFGEVTHGVSRSIDKIQQAGAAVGSLATTGLPGLEGVSKWFDETIAKQNKEIEEAPSAAPSFEDVDSFDQGARYVFSTFGEMAPDMFGAIVSAGVGTAVGRKALQGVVERQAIVQAMKGAPQQVRNELVGLARGQLTKDQLQDVTKELLVNETSRIAGKYGALPAMAANSVGQEVGSIYADLKDNPDLSESDRKAAALNGGLIAGMADFAVEGWIASKFFKKPNVSRGELDQAKSFLKRFTETYGKEFIKASPGEAGTELFQTVVEEASKNWADPEKRDAIFAFNPEQKKAFIDSMLKGGIGGGVMAGVSTLAVMPPARDPLTRQAERDILSKADDAAPDAMPVIEDDTDKRLSAINNRKLELEDLRNNNLSDQTILQKIDEEYAQLNAEEQTLLGEDEKEEEKPLVNEKKEEIKEEKTNEMYQAVQDLRDTVAKRIDREMGERTEAVDLVAVETKKKEWGLNKVDPKIISSLDDRTVNFLVKEGIEIRQPTEQERKSRMKGADTFGVIDTKDGGIALLIPSKAKMDKLGLYQVENLVSHEVIHVADYVQLRKEAKEKGLKFSEHEKNTMEERGRILRAALPHIASQTAKAYLRSEVSMTDRQLGQEFVRMAVEAMRAGKLEEVTQAIAEAQVIAQEPKANGVLNNFMKVWMKVIGDLYDNIVRMFDNKTTPEPILKAINQINAVLDKYGVLAEGQPKTTIKAPPSQESQRGTTSTADVFEKVQKKPEPPKDEEKKDEKKEEAPLPETLASDLGVRYDGFTDVGGLEFHSFSDTKSINGKTISFTVEGTPTAENVKASHDERVAAFKAAEKPPVAPLVNEKKPEPAAKATPKPPVRKRRMQRAEQAVTNSVEKSLTDSEKTELGKLMGGKGWNKSTAKEFNKFFADWLAKTRRATGRLLELTKKVLDGISARVLAAIIAFSPFHEAGSIMTPQGEVTQELNLESPETNLDRVTIPEMQYRITANQTFTAPIQVIGVSIPKESPKLGRYADFGGQKHSPEVARLADWVVRTGDNQTSSFFVGDKKNGMAYMFTSDGQLVESFPALYGKDYGDTLQGDSFAGAPAVTPAGRFETVLDRNAEDYGQTIDLVDEEGDYVVSIHRLYTKKPEQQRAQRLASSTAHDNRISMGCVNVSDSAFDESILPNATDGVIVYIMPESGIADSLVNENDDGAAMSNLETAEEKRAIAEREGFRYDGNMMGSLDLYTDYAQTLPRLSQAQLTRRDEAVAQLKANREGTSKQLGTTEIGYSFVGTEEQNDRAIKILAERQKLENRLENEFGIKGVNTRYHNEWVTDATGRTVLDVDNPLKGQVRDRQVFLRGPDGVYRWKKMEDAGWSLEKYQRAEEIESEWKRLGRDPVLNVAVMSPVGDTQFRNEWDPTEEELNPKAEQVPNPAYGATIGIKTPYTEDDLLEKFEETREKFTTPLEDKPAAMANIRTADDNRTRRVLKESLIQANRISNQSIMGMDVKESERRAVAGEVQWGGATPLDLEYSTQTHTGSTYEAQALVNEKGDALAVAEILDTDPMGQSIGLSDWGPDSKLGAVYENVIRQLVNAINLLHKKGAGDSVASGEMIRLYTTLEERYRQMNRAGGSMSAYTGKSTQITSGLSARKAMDEVTAQASEKVLGKEAKSKFQNLRDELNNLWKKYATNVANSPKVIAALRKLHKIADKSKFVKGARETIIKDIKRLESLVNKAAARASEYVAGINDSDRMVNKVVEHVIKEMSGVRDASMPDELDLVRSALNQIGMSVEEFHRGPTIDEPQAKAKLRDKFAALLRNEALYDQFVIKLRAQYISSYGGQNPSSAFMEKVDRIFNPMMNRAWRPGMVKTLVNETLREYEVKLAKLVRQSFEKGSKNTFEETSTIAERVKNGLIDFMKDEGVTDQKLIDTLAEDIDSEINDAIETARLEFFTGKGTIREFLKSMGESLAKTAKNHVTFIEGMESKFLNFLVNKGYPNTKELPIASTLAKAMQDTFNEMVYAERVKIIKKWQETALDAKTKKKPLVNEKMDKVVERILQMANIGAIRQEDIYRALQSKFDLPEYTPETAAEITRLGDLIGTSSSTRAKDELKQRLADYLTQKRGLKTSDIYTSWMYFSMLSGPSTWMVNIAGNLTSLMGYIVTESTKAIATGNYKRIPMMLRSMVNVMTGVAATEAKYSFLTGMALGKQGQKYFSRTNPIEQKDFYIKEAMFEDGRLAEIDKAVASFVQKASRNLLGQYVGRFLAATDIFFYKIAEEMAYTARGGDMAITPDMYRSAMAQARGDLLLQGKDPDTDKSARLQQKVIAHSLLNDFTDTDESFRKSRFRDKAGNLVNEKVEAWKEAHAEALDATFTQEPRGILGFAAEAMEKLTEKVPILKLLIPFTRVAANVTNQMVEWTPYGIARYLFGHVYGDDFRILKDDMQKRDSNIAIRGILGTLAIIALIASADDEDEGDPYFTIYGDGPKDIELRRQMQQRGWKPNTIKVGGSYWSYLYTPLAMAFSIVGKQFDRAREGKGDPSVMGIASPASAVALLDAVKNQSFLAGITDLFSALDSPDPESRVARIFGRMSTIGVPNVFKQLDKAIDPSIQEAQGFYETAIREIPIARHVLKPALNIFGKPVERVGGIVRFPGLERFMTMEKTDDPVLNLMSEKALKVPGISKSTHLGDEKMTVEQYYEYVELTGPNVYDRYRSEISILRGLSREAAQERLEQISREEKADAREKLKEKYNISR